MIDLALDPSETRPAPQAQQRGASDRRKLRIALLSVVGLAGTGAFAGLANTYLSGLAGPQRTPLIVMSTKAADWPDLKDGLPALATASVAAVPKVREILPPEPAPPPVVETRIEPALRAEPAPVPVAATTPAPTGPVPNQPATAARPKPPLVDVAVIGPSRQATLVPPARIALVLPPLAGETVRAKTGRSETAHAEPEAATTSFAALPPEEARSPATKPARPEAIKAKPRIEAHAKPSVNDKAPTAGKLVAERSTAKPAAVAAKAAPAEASAEDEDAEVFGIKVPSLAPAGRKIRESVEALGDAVKGIPDRF